MVWVLLSASVERLDVSCMRDFLVNKTCNTQPKGRGRGGGGNAAGGGGVGGGGMR